MDKEAWHAAIHGVAKSRTRLSDWSDLIWNSILGEGNGTPLQYSCLQNPMDRGTWWAAVHGVAKSQTRLSDFTFTFHFHALEKEMATHSSVLAWRIPRTGEPRGLPSMGSQSRTWLKRLSSSSSSKLNPTTQGDNPGKQILCWLTWCLQPCHPVEH